MPWGYAAAGAAAGLAGSLSSKGGNTQSTSNTEPWAWQQPYLASGYSRAEELYGNGSYNYAANQSPFTRQAQQLTVQRALDPNSLVGQSQGVLGDTIGGKYLSPDSNPYLKASVQDALGLAGSAFAGQYGGAAGNNLGNSGYQEGLARTLGSVATNAYSNAYGSERQNQLNATQMAPTLDYANINQLAGVGAQQENLAQQQYQSPWESLARYQAAIQGNVGSLNTTQSPYFTNPAATALGGAMGGVALGNAAQRGGIFGQQQGMGYNSNPYFGGQNLAQPDYNAGYF
jgi:hypothetical protein